MQLDFVSTKLDWIIAGVDEAGRGPLAGPVVAGAVILPGKPRIRGLADSKALSPKQRAELAHEIRERAVAWAVAAADHLEIDRLNILGATLLAMQRAVAALAVTPVQVLVDGNQCPKLSCQVQPVIGGDASVPAISAASILAKVHRDELMTGLDSRYPGYGFAHHMGYSTPEHLAALDSLGACEIHRRSFAPVQRVLERAAERVALLP